MDAETSLVGRGGLSRKLLSTGLIVVSALVLFISLKALFTPSPEEQIRRAIRKASEVIERHNLRKTLSYLSRDYKDDMGFDYQTLAYTGAQIFRAYPEISVSSKILSVSIQEDGAEVDLIAEVLGTIPPQKSEDLLAWRRSHRFLVTFKKEKGKWKVVETEKPKENLQ